MGDGALVDPNGYAFTGGMKYLGSNFDSLTTDEKVALFKSTSLKEPSLADLKLLKPFYVRIYYED